VVQAVNFVYGMWLVIVTLSTSGLQNSSIGLVLQPAAAATALVLLYVAWRHGWIANARVSGRTSRTTQGSTEV
jgi:succinate dehydrogenase hydrophobic anchor subunit